MSWICELTQGFEKARLRAEVERLKAEIVADRANMKKEIQCEELVRTQYLSEIQRLRKALEEIRLHTDPEPDAENYRIDDSEGCLDAVFDIARAALDGGNEEPKP